MILGIGTDIIEIDRVSAACERGNFLERYFSPAELALFKNRKPETIAGNFGCKEAAAKALGCGFKFFLPDAIEVLRTAEGAPEVFFHGAAKEMADKKGVAAIHATISHCERYASAFVVLEGRP